MSKLEPFHDFDMLAKDGDNVTQVAKKQIH